MNKEEKKMRFVDSYQLGAVQVSASHINNVVFLRRYIPTGWSGTKLKAWEKEHGSTMNAIKENLQLTLNK